MRDYLGYRACSIQMGRSGHHGGVELRAELPVGYEAWTTKDEMFHDLLPVWNARVRKNTGFTEDDADRCISLRNNFYERPGHFWGGGMLVNALRLAMQGIWMHAEFVWDAVLLEQQRAAGWRMQEIRDRLSSAEWGVTIGDPNDGLVCSITGQRFAAALLSPGSIPAVAVQIALLLAESGDDAWVGECCDEVDVFLYRNAAGFVGARQRLPGLPPPETVTALLASGLSLADARDSFDDQFMAPSPGAWTPFRQARLCSDSVVNALLADYYFDWAHRLHSWWRDLLLDSYRDGPSHSSTALGSLRPEEHVHACAVAAARLALAHLGDLQSLLVHEWCHATQNLLSPVKYHCRVPDELRWLYEVTGSEGDQLDQGCFHYVFAASFAVRFRAEYGLVGSTAVGSRASPNWYSRDDDEPWRRVWDRQCELAGSDPLTEVLFEEKGVGVWPQLRPVCLVVGTPVTCLREGTSLGETPIWETTFGQFNGYRRCRGPAVADLCEAECRSAASALDGTVDEHRYEHCLRIRCGRDLVPEGVADLCRSLCADLTRSLDGSVHLGAYDRCLAERCGVVFPEGNRDQGLGS